MKKYISCLFLSVFFFLLQTPKVLADEVGRLISIADTFDWAYKDCLSIPYPETTVYLTLYNISPAERLEFIKVLSWHCNSLSTEPDIIPLVIVVNTDNSLVRIDLRDFGWKKETWEKLGTFDPYFHFRQKISKVVRVKRTKTINGKLEWDTFYNNTTKAWEYQYDEKVDLVEENLLAPWCYEDFTAAPELSSLRKATLKLFVERSKTATPILRADFFLRKTGISKDDTNQGIPGYYDFLKLGNKLDDFLNLLGGKEVIAAAKKQRKEVAAVIDRSADVALNNRILVRIPTFNGSFWQSLDAQQSTGTKNAIRNNDPNDFVIDASESFGNLPNGLFAWFLSDGKGARQDTAPDFIASNKRKQPGNDARVHTWYGCQQCHTRGIIPPEDYIRSHINLPLKFNSEEYDKIKRFRQLYFSDLQNKVDSDAIQYENAVRVASGFKDGKEASVKFIKWFSRYQDNNFTLTDIERDVALPKAKIIEKLKVLAIGTQNIDIVIAAITTKPETFSIRSEMYEEIFPLLMSNLKGFVP